MHLPRHLENRHVERPCASIGGTKQHGLYRRNSAPGRLRRTRRSLPRSGLPALRCVPKARTDGVADAAVHTRLAPGEATSAAAQSRLGGDRDDGGGALLGAEEPSLSAAAAHERLGHGKISSTPRAAFLGATRSSPASRRNIPPRDGKPTAIPSLRPTRVGPPFEGVPHMEQEQISTASNWRRAGGDRTSVTIDSPAASHQARRGRIRSSRPQRARSRPASVVERRTRYG